MNAQEDLDSEKVVSKVRRVNSRWIVHGNLRKNAAAYLDHLERVDSERLQRSCELALEMVRRKDVVRDPKPLFYSGLFARATRKEIAEYLHEHPFTRAVVMLLHGDASAQDSLHGCTFWLADSIAREVAEKLGDRTPAFAAC